MNALPVQMAPSASPGSFAALGRDRLLGRSRLVESLPTARLSGHRLIRTDTVGTGRRARSRALYANDNGISDTGLASAIHVPESSIQNSAKALSSAGPLAVDRLIILLERLPAEWAGPGTSPPSVEAVADVLTVSYLISPLSKMPEVEVDPDSGSVSLIWTRRDKRRSFALMFDGDRRVIGTIACLDGGQYVPWSLAVDQEVQIAARLENSDVAELLTDQ